MRGPILIVLLAAAAPLYPQSASFDDLARRARAALEAERVDDAIDLYSRAARIRPGWSEGWWHLGTLLFDRERFAEARDAFTHFTGNEPKAGPGFAMTGLCEFQLKRYPQALAALERGLELGLGSNRELVRSALYRDGTLHSLLGRPEFALQRLTLLVNQDADAHRGGDTRSVLQDQDVVDALGIAALRLKLLPSEIPPDRSAAIRRAGRAQGLFALVDWVAAAGEFRQLASDFPAEPGIHYMYGVFLLKEHPGEAVAEFQKEIAVSPGDVDARVQIAFADLTAGEQERGRKYASEAVRMAPGNFAAHVAYGRLLLESGDVRQALAETRTAVKLAPDSADAHLALSLACTRADRPLEAKRERAEFERLKARRER